MASQTGRECSATYNFSVWLLFSLQINTRGYYYKMFFSASIIFFGNLFIIQAFFYLLKTCVVYLPLFLFL